jgi:hypothetical protein
VVVITTDAESCDALGRELAGTNDEVYVVHAKITGDPLVLTEQFRHAKHGALIGARMLSETVDIPGAEIGISIAAPGTRLQITRQMGRILRKGSPKEAPAFYQYLAVPGPADYLPGEDDLRFLEDLAWVRDTALRMGLDADVAWNEELIRAQALQAEDSFHNRFFGMDYAKIPKYGAFNPNEVMGRLSDQSVFRMVSILQNLPASREITDSEWARILRVACGKKKREGLRWDPLDIPGSWWLLILGKRSPAKITEIFTKLRPPGEYSPDEEDQRVVREAAEEIIRPRNHHHRNVPDGVAPVPPGFPHVRPRVEVTGVRVPAGGSAPHPGAPGTLASPGGNAGSAFTSGMFTVSEVALDHETGELFEGPPAGDARGDEEARMTLEDLLEPE